MVKEGDRVRMVKNLLTNKPSEHMGQEGVVTFVGKGAISVTLDSGELSAFLHGECEVIAS